MKGNKRRVRVSVRIFFTFSVCVCASARARVCVSACVCVCVCVCVSAFVCVCVCVLILALYMYIFFIMVYILFHNLLNFRYMYNEFHMPSVSLAVSVSELQSESDARSITTGSCSSSTAISFLQYTCSIDKTCSTHFAHSPGVMPLMPSSISSLIAVRLKAKFFLALNLKK